MSKSLGNFFTVRDLLDQGVPGEVIRLVLLQTHYRRPMDWTENKRREAERELAQWRTVIGGVEVAEVSPAAIGALSNDLNVHGVITELRRLFKVGEFGRLKSTANLIGLLTDEVAWDFPKHYIIHAETGQFSLTHRELLVSIESKFDELRRSAKITHDFSAVDALKTALIDLEVEVRMKKDKVELFAGKDVDISKLEALK